MSAPADELLEELKRLFDSQFTSDKQLESLLKLIEDGKGDYTKSFEFATRTGDILSSAFRKVLTAEKFDTPYIPREIAELIIPPMLRQNYQIVSKICEKVQKALNYKAEIGMKPFMPKENSDREKGIVSEVNNYTNLQQQVQHLQSSTRNYTQSVNDDWVHQNADKQYDFGLRPKIIRTAVGGCCKWCQEVAGIYDYQDVKNTGNDVFRRHKNCDCLVVYDPADGSKLYQDVWNKGLYSTNQYRAEIQKRYQDYYYRVEKNWLNSTYRNGKIITGGRITDPHSEYAERWAKSYYEEIRHKSTDYLHVAEKTGINVEEAKKIKEYLFINKSLFDEDFGIWRRFDEDAAIAQSWQRLAEGTPLSHDYTLVMHELYEMQIKANNPAISHDLAHMLATLKYDYGTEADQYYDNLRKSKKR